MAIARRSFIFRKLLLTLIPPWPLLHYWTNRLLENLFQTFPSQSTTFEIFAFYFILENHFCCLFGNWSAFWIFGVFSRLISQIYLIPNKYFHCVRHNIFYLREPLNQIDCTFFLALVKDEGYITENAIRKTSVPG